MADRLANKVVLVTGASADVGRACSLLLLEKGYTVVGTDPDFPRAGIDERRFHPIAVNFSDLDSLPGALIRVGRDLPEIEAMILCADAGHIGSLEQISWNQVRSTIDSNFTSQAYVVKQFLPQLKQQGYGNIIFIGSESTLNGDRRGAIYNASKFALRGLAQALREDCSDTGIRITIINPGLVRNGFIHNLDTRHDIGNIIEPGAVAEAALEVLQARPGTVFDEINLSPSTQVVRVRKTGKPIE
ncbi:MAG: SDR family NAD(P)-dependent oxidoreductase [Gammaproteobacteria bacterium]|nr:SDR family NAD(P)-dependent oxidoreductase [Gammaproteobacteria bacterium]